jgi:hypothetical protein
MVGKMATNERTLCIRFSRVFKTTAAHIIKKKDVFIKAPTIDTAPTTVRRD